MVGTMIAAGIGLTGYAATAAAFAVNFAVSMIVTRVFGQDQQGPQDSGTREQVPPSNTNAIPVVYGDAYLGGTFVDAVLSTDQKTMYYVMAVSCISPNGQFTFDTTDMYYGDRLIIFDGTDQTKVVSLTDEAGNVDDKISGNLYISLYKSSASGTITSLNGASAPNVVMGGSDIDAALRWPSTGRQMNGLAFAIIKLNYNTDAGTTNLSPITFKASHYLNSTGVAKPGDVWYDYITNKEYGGAVGWMPDGSFDPLFVDTASVAAINSYADGLITYTPSGGGSATEARYRINGVIDAGQTVLSNLDKVMTCCDSWMAYNAAAGQWSIVINKSESAAYSFDDDNIIGEIRVSATDITQSINQVEAKFPNGESRDQPDFVNIATPTGLLYPNEPVNKYSVSYDLVNDSVRAQYLANRILEQAREDLIVSFSTTYYGIQVDAGDVVSVTNSDYGWTNKLFRVVKVNEASLPDGGLGAKLEMTEYSAAVYDDFDITAYTPVPNSNLPSASYFSPLAAPIVSSSSPGSAIPNFNVSITIPTTGRVTYSELYYTTAAIPTSSDWKLLSSASTSDGQPVAPSSTYVYANQVLPTGASTTATYYFGYLVGNDLSKSTLSPISASFTWSPVVNSGPFVDISGFTAFSKSETGTITPSSATLTAITNNVTSPTYAWTVVGATPSSGSSSTITITPTSVATSVNVTLEVNGSNLITPITRQTTLAIIDSGQSGDSVDIVFQRSATQPATPSPSVGTPTTWYSDVNSVPSGSDPIWSSVGTNTGIGTNYVWQTPLLIEGQNGAAGLSVAELLIYIRAATAPTTPTGGSYNFTTQVLTAPASWSSAIPAGTDPVYTSRSVASVQGITGTDSTLTWTSPVLSIQNGADGTNGTNGINGNSSRICYTKTTLSSLDASPTTITTSGAVSYPPNDSWGAGTVWGATAPAIVAGESVYQSDGVYSPATGNTVWNVPYLSTLKVGSLSAITANTGALTVTGNFTAGTAAISGTTMTGSGGILYSGGNFALGNSTTNISFNGTQMTLNGNVVGTTNINANAVTVPVFAQITTTYTMTGYIGDQAFLSATTDTGGSPVVIIFAIDCAISNASPASVTFPLEISVGGTVIRTYNLVKPPGSGTSYRINGVLYVASPPSGSFTIRFAINYPAVTGETLYFYPQTASSTYTIGTSGNYFYTLGTKR